MFYFYLLREGCYFFNGVCLSFCLAICCKHYSKGYERIVMKSYKRVRGGKGNKWINFGGDLDLCADCQSESCPLRNKLWKYLYEIIQWYKEHWLNFWGDLDSPNQESGQYGGNELPWPRRSVLSEFFYSCNVISIDMTFFLPYGSIFINDYIYS